MPPSAKSDMTSNTSLINLAQAVNTVVGVDFHDHMAELTKRPATFDQCAFHRQVQRNNFDVLDSHARPASEWRLRAFSTSLNGKLIKPQRYQATHFFSKACGRRRTGYNKPIDLAKVIDRQFADKALADVGKVRN
jgi:hypothetical protein